MYRTGRTEYHETDRFHITFAKRKYHADQSQHITVQTKRKRRIVITNLLFSVVSGFDIRPSASVHTNAMPATIIKSDGRLLPSRITGTPKAHFICFGEPCCVPPPSRRKAEYRNAAALLCRLRLNYRNKKRQEPAVLGYYSIRRENAGHGMPLVPLRSALSGVMRKEKA